MKHISGSFRSIFDLLLVSGGSFSAQLIMILYAFIMARGLGPELFGQFSGIYSIVGLSITLVNWGLDNWMLNESRYYTSVRQLAGNILTTKIISSGFWSLLMLLILTITKPIFFSNAFVIFAFGDVFCEAAFSSLIAAWNIQRDTKKIAYMLLISRLGKFLLLLALIQLNILSPLHVAISRFLVALLIMIVSLYFVKPNLFNQTLYSYLQILKKSAPFGSSEILANIYANADIAIMSFISFGTNVGLYSSASGGLRALYVIPYSIYNLLLPKYSKELSLSTSENRKMDIIKIIGLYLLIGTFLATIVFFAGSSFIDRLLGQAYHPAGEIITILSPILFLKSIEFGLVIIIVIFGFQGRRLIPQFFATIISILGTIIVLPVYGIIGVAWVFVASELILTIGYLWIVTKINLDERL